MWPWTQVLCSAEAHNLVWEHSCDGAGAATATGDSGEGGWAATAEQGGFLKTVLQLRPEWAGIKTSGNANQNHKKVSSHTSQNGHHQNGLQTINAGDGVEKREPSCTVDGNASTDKTTMENSVAIPLKTRNKTTTPPSNPTTGLKKTPGPQRFPQHSWHQLDAPADERIRTHTHTEVTLRYKKERVWVRSNEADKPRAYYTEGSQKDKDKYHALMHI